MAINDTNAAIKICAIPAPVTVFYIFGCLTCQNFLFEIDDKQNVHVYSTKKSKACDNTRAMLEQKLAVHVKKQTNKTKVTLHKYKTDTKKESTYKKNSQTKSNNVCNTSMFYHKQFLCAHDQRCTIVPKTEM